MFNTRRGALFAAVCSAGLALGLAAPASAETLAEAIALAYDSNPTLQAQRATQRALDENWVQARSGYRPQASAQGRVGYSEVRRPGGVDRNLNGIRDPEGRNLVESNSAIATLSLSQPLYTGGRVAATVSAAEADILTGRENRCERQALAHNGRKTADTWIDMRPVYMGRGDQKRAKNLAVLGRTFQRVPP